MGVRCAVIGAGTMGALYAEAFAKSRDAELTCVVDLDVERAGALAGVHGVSALGSLGQLLREGRPDAVAIAVPDFAHTQPVLDCLAAGVHVLCEKPLTMDVAEAERIVAACEASSGSLMVNYGNRRRASLIELRRRIEAGELGTIESIALRGHETASKIAGLAWHDRTDPTWFLVSHLVDLLQWIAGSEVVRVAGAAGRGRPDALAGYEGPTSVTYVAELAGGASATLASSWLLPDSSPVAADFTVEVIGTRGTARMDFGSLGATYLGGGVEAQGWDFVMPDQDGRPQGWWFQSCAAFVAGVRDGRPAGPDAAEGAQVTRVLAAMSAALERGESVAVEGAAAGRAA
ncbi:Gfo/Idh/MocA family protein [Conexibacter arvalis]|uniref:Putative dehydrogenase n=1 Tax=Conexibacter arvalis TaxID=912552 RepID=A0A840IC02_9ACTN|nr:Gfo/Idh/MocA family oxidoreductase [Conexibacter arvalis]MBB4662419.1 putative dehydrogenase [Conexibacter arvalis]